MSLHYFDDPKKKEVWEKEIQKMRQEKAHRKNETASVLKKLPEETEKSRVQITYEQLLEREYGTSNPFNVISTPGRVRQKEKSKEMGGKKL